MIERSESSAPSRVLYHQFRPSTQLRKDLELLVKPGMHPGFLFDSPRQLSIDLEDSLDYRFDTQIQDAGEAFHRRARRAPYDEMRIRRLGGRMLNSVMLGVVFAIDHRQLTGVTQDLFSMQPVREHQPGLLDKPRRQYDGMVGEEEVPAESLRPNLRWRIAKTALVNDDEDRALEILSTIQNNLEGDKGRLYTVTPASIVGRDYQG